MVNLLAQRVAIDEFHDNKIHPICFANFVDVRDVRMVERGGGLRFPNETFHPIAIRSYFCWQDLQRHFAIEFGVVR